MKYLPTQHTGLARHQVIFLVSVGSFVVGVVLGALGLWVAQTPPMQPHALRESDLATTASAYSFIDPLIGIKGIGTTAPYKAIQDQVAAYIAKRQKEGGLTNMSVDFRDINQPGGFVLNPTEQYTPASLNKVPLMMAYYKLAQTDPGILTHEIAYSGSTDNNSVEDIRSTVQLTPGTRYTIEQLIEHMIRYSDNNAAGLLGTYLSDTKQTAAYASVYSDLGVNPSVLDTYTDNMTVQQYSIFLRALYNATYLTREQSEQALKLLSETDFSAGIESGVPNHVPVAQKFGEVVLVDNNDTMLGKEVHNCGIVYYPKHPYLLCIMTKAPGDNVQALENDIATVSRLIYTNMQKLYP